MVEYVKATLSDTADILDFLNYVFSQAYGPHDFKALLPGIYGEGVERLSVEHYLAKEDGRIKAVVANRPCSFSVAGTVLRAGLIGNVAVHPHARGKGYMKHLLSWAMQEARTAKTDLMILGGQRQRYGYFDFENAGLQLVYRISSDNIRHCFRDIDASKITFCNIYDVDEETLKFTSTLYKKRPLHTERPWEEYLNTMHNGSGTCRVLYKSGRPIGYSYKGTQELILENESDLPLVLKALFAEDGLTKTDLPVSPFEKERCDFLERICESVNVKQMEMIRVFCWDRVLAAYLSLKAGYTGLEDGVAELCIENEGYRITVQKGNPQVEKTAVGAEAVTLSVKEAQRLLFGINGLVLPDKRLKNWAPLPFVVDVPDRF